MSQKSSLPQPTQSVSRVLTADTNCVKPASSIVALPARADARPRVHVHRDRPEPSRARGGVLIDPANRLAVVKGRPVLPVRIDRGVSAGRAHGERHHRAHLAANNKCLADNNKPRTAPNTTNKQSLTFLHTGRPRSVQIGAASAANGEKEA
jgi:hypothetical protein